MRSIYSNLYEIISKRLENKYDKGEEQSYWVFFNPDITIMENEWGDNKFRPRIRLKSHSYHIHSPNYYELGIIEENNLNTSWVEFTFPSDYFKSIRNREEFIDNCIFKLGKLLSSVLEGVFTKQIFGPSPIVVFAYEDTLIKRYVGGAKYDLEGLFKIEFIKIAVPGEFGIETKIVIRFNLFPMKCPINVYYEFIPDSLIIE